MEAYQNKYIFTPGPVKMSEDILALGAQQTPYFRNEAFSKVLLECEENLLRILNAPQGSKAVFLTASGTAGMEAAVTNLIGKEDKVLVINGGAFGQRFLDICDIHKYQTMEYCTTDDDLSDTSKLEAYKEATALLLNAHETSVGLLYDLGALGKFSHKHDLLFVVDAISMFITDHIDMSAQHIDAVIVSSHKGLALPPGLSMVILSPKAMERLQEHPSLYFDFKRYLRDGERGQTPFTPAVTIILQLQLRLRQIMANGIENEIKRAAELARYFRESIAKLPLRLANDFMPNAMTTLSPIDGKTAYQVVLDLDMEYNVVVAPNGGELKDKLFRVSHMGDMNKAYIDVLINALYDYYGVER